MKKILFILLVGIIIIVSVTSLTIKTYQNANIKDFSPDIRYVKHEHTILICDLKNSYTIDHQMDFPHFHQFPTSCEYIPIDFLDHFPVDIEFNITNLEKNLSFSYTIPAFYFLDLDRQTITDELITEIKQIKSLVIAGTDLKDISFLEQLPNLEYLSINSRDELSSSEIDRFPTLLSPKKLQFLELEKLIVYNTTSLKEATNIKSLKTNSIPGVQPMDNSFISHLINLETLDFSYQKLNDISFLKNLKKLTNLDLSHNQITDISSLQNLTNLQYLDLSLNQIQDCNSLNQLTNIISIDLSNNQIQNIEGISELETLLKLNLDDNQINSIEPLSQLKNLKYLNLSNNQITDITPLSKLSNLTELFLSNNQISEINSLSNLTNLQSIFLGNNQITKIEPLLNLSQLTLLSLRQNQISTLPNQLPWETLNYFDISENPIQDYSPLNTLPINCYIKSDQAP